MTSYFLNALYGKKPTANTGADGKPVLACAASGAQADIGLHYIEKKREERRQIRKSNESGKKVINTKGANKKIAAAVDKLNTESNLKQVQKNKFKRGHQANKQKTQIMQIQAMQAKMASNQGKGAISEMLDSM